MKTKTIMKRKPGRPKTGRAIENRCLRVEDAIWAAFSKWSKRLGGEPNASTLRRQALIDFLKAHAPKDLHPPASPWTGHFTTANGLLTIGTTGDALNAAQTLPTPKRLVNT